MTDYSPFDCITIRKFLEGIKDEIEKVDLRSPLSREIKDLLFAIIEQRLRITELEADEQFSKAMQ